MTEFICKKCGKCCLHYPCNLHPSDLKSIAKYLKISIKELISEYLKISIKELISEYLIWDYWIGDDGNEYFLVPKRKNDIGGSIASWGWALESRPCIFLDEKTKLCEIHPVKPKGGYLSQCEGEYKGYSKEEAKEDWRNHPLTLKMSD